MSKHIHKNRVDKSEPLEGNSAVLMRTPDGLLGLEEEGRQNRALPEQVTPAGLGRQQRSVHW